MDNNGIREIVKGLKRDSCLDKLHIELANSIVLIMRVWTALGRVLWDRRRINRTFSSNHTLCGWLVDRCDHAAKEYDPGFDEISHNLSLPKYIHAMLGMNNNEDKLEVAREKILKHHFSRRECAKNIPLFARMPESVSVYAIEWIGRDDLGYSIMYDVVRGSPHLFGTGSVQHGGDAVGKKRKSDALEL